MKTFLLRLHSGLDDDLIQWLSTMDGQPYGVKSRAVKEALRRGLSASDTSPQTSVDLGEIRSVVEAAVESALARLEGPALVRSAPDDGPEDDEMEQMLDDLASVLILKE